MTSKDKLGVSSSVQRFLTSEYYGLNVMVLSTYAILRNVYYDKPLEEGGVFFGDIKEFPTWERYAFMACLSSAAFRYFKAVNTDAAIATVIAHAQLFVCVMALVSNFIALTYYLIAFGTIFLLFTQPMAPWGDKIEIMLPPIFLEEVLSPTSENVYVVIYYTDWNSTCRQMASTFNELANRYGTEKLRFSKFDIGEFHAFAKRLDIEVSSISAQLPTIALYEKGEEQTRLPKKAGGKVYGAGYKARDIIRAFELDMRYARSMQKTVEPKKDK